MTNLTPNQLASMENFLTQKFQELLENMDDRYGNFERKLSHQTNTMEVLKNIFKDLQNKVCKLESKYETLEKENLALVTKQNTMEKENQDMKHRIKELELYTQDSAHEVNQSKLEITGVPTMLDYSSFTETLFEKTNLKTLIKEDYTITTIDKKTKHGSPPEIKSLVITVKDKNTRNSVLAALRKERPTITTRKITGQGSDTPIYISEYLTPQLKRVLYEAKQMKRSKQYEYLWVRNGHILVRKTSNSDAVRISSIQDLANM